MAKVDQEKVGSGDSKSAGMGTRNSKAVSRNGEIIHPMVDTIRQYGKIMTFMQNTFRFITNSLHGYKLEKQACLPDLFIATIGVCNRVGGKRKTLIECAGLCLDLVNRTIKEH